MARFSTDDHVFDAWLDDRLDAPERTELEVQLEQDDRLREQFDGYTRTVRLLRRMPPVEAPPDLLRGVQSRIRRRTRGRWFASVATSIRFPWEAAFNIVLLGVLVATYMGAVPTADPQPAPVDAEVFRLGGGAFETGASVLSEYGHLEVVQGSLSDQGVAYRVTIDRSDLAPLRSELALYPDLTLQAATRPAVDPARIEVRVFAARPL